MNAMSKKKRSYLNHIILDIVREMQPISYDNLWLELGENLDFESNKAKKEVMRVLGGMEKKNIQNNNKMNKGRYVMKKRKLLLIILLATFCFSTSYQSLLAAEKTVKFTVPGCV